jgi:CDP-diacylglycerol--serine O-phosphatidyltransferase
MVCTNSTVTTTMTAPPKKPFSMIRSFVLADFITLGNAVTGTSAILACMAYLASGGRGYVWAALVLLPVALVCDILDGTVARWRHRHSHLGADLDSLADVVSFGVAPAVLGFTLGLRGGGDAAALLFFVACGISRLARYNATAEELSQGLGKVAYYEGAPIPTSLSIVLVLGIAFGMGRTGSALWFGELHLGPVALHPLALLYVIRGSAMIITILVPKH